MMHNVLAHIETWSASNYQSGSFFAYIPNWDLYMYAVTTLSFVNVFVIVKKPSW